MRPTSFLRTASHVLLFLAARASVAHGQQKPRGAARCDGRVIHEIRVSALRPPFSGEAAYWRRVARSIGLHHVTTDTAVVRRFLALQVGGTCSEFRIRESTRLLREQPFLADARISSVPDDSGGVQIDVETTDEIPAVASASVSGGRLSYLEIGNENMFGDAWLLALHAADRPLPGRSIGGRMSDYQFLGRPYQLDVQADWGQRTAAWLIDASHAYLTDLQKIAWEAGLAHARQEFFVLNRGDGFQALAIAYRRAAADIGGVLKLGNLRTPILVGALATFLRLEPLGAVSVGNHGVTPDTTLAGFYSKQSRARLTAIAAWRNLNFITARGFEALTANQDLPTGFQLFGQVGPGMKALGGADDIFALADLLGGVGSPKTYAELHIINEARKEFDKPLWDGIVSSSRLGLYWKPNDKALWRGWLETGAGWRAQVPFQLSLATEDQRLLGYRGTLSGARRVAGGLEARRVLSSITSRADVGVAAFMNAAELWAGDAPFGVDTPLLPTVGVSLLGALPKGSQRLLRIDLGTALHRGIARGGWEIRLTYRDVTRKIREEPGDVSAGREQLVGPDVFRP